MHFHNFYLLIIKIPSRPLPYLISSTFFEDLTFSLFGPRITIPMVLLLHLLAEMLTPIQITNFDKTS